MALEVFVPKVKERTFKEKEHDLTVGSQGRAMFTAKGKTALALVVGDGVIQAKEGNTLYIAKRPIGVKGGYNISKVGKEESEILAFGGKTLLQLFPAGRYKFTVSRPDSIPVEGAANANVTWHQLELMPPVEKKPKADKPSAE